MINHLPGCPEGSGIEWINGIRGVIWQRCRGCGQMELGAGPAAPEKGTKQDAGKPSVFRGALAYFPLALKEVARVSEDGINQPGQTHQWGGNCNVEDGFARYTESMARHLLDEAQIYYSNPSIDLQIGHAAITAWNAMNRLEWLCRQKGEKRAGEFTKKIGVRMGKGLLGGDLQGALHNVSNGIGSAGGAGGVAGTQGPSGYGHLGQGNPLGESLERQRKGLTDVGTDFGAQRDQFQYENR